MGHINSIGMIQSLVRTGCTDWSQHGDVGVKQYGDLMQFNYTPAAQFAGRWNHFERVSRGLILHAETGAVVARPFDKFFNYGEGGRHPAEGADVRSAWEKMDGSLGIIYHHDGQWRVATRGSLESEQAQWATEFLHERIDAAYMDPGCTYLAEVIYPENRVVVDYGNLRMLFLLAIRDRATGEYAPWKAVKMLAYRTGFNLPVSYDHADITTILAAKEDLDVNREGYVVEFTDGSRFKIKGDAYVEMHRLISGLSFKNTLRAIQDGTIDDLLERVPDEFLDNVRQWQADIASTLTDIVDACQQAFADAPKHDRKAFAAYVLEHHKPLSAYLFAMLDGKDIEPMIYRMAFKNGGES